MDFITFILTAFSAITGGTALYSLLLFRRQAKRFKTAEAFEKEVTALRSTIDGMQKQVAWQETRIVEMQKMLVDKDVYIATLSADKNTLEIKHAKNKGAINTAYGCTYCDNASNCPVLMRRTVNEEEFLKSIDRTNVDNNSK